MKWALTCENLWWHEFCSSSKCLWTCFIFLIPRGSCRFRMPWKPRIYQYNPGVFCKTAVNIMLSLSSLELNYPFQLLQILSITNTAIFKVCLENESHACRADFFSPIYSQIPNVQLDQSLISAVLWSKVLALIIKPHTTLVFSYLRVCLLRELNYQHSACHHKKTDVWAFGQGQI